MGRARAFDCDGTLWSGDAGETFFDWEINRNIVSAEIGRAMRSRYAEYKAGKLSYKPEWVVNDPIEFRLNKDDKAFLKRPDGKELEVVVVKKVRQQ